MPLPRILFADNKLDFLRTRAEFLQMHYEVLKASSPGEVAYLLRDDWIHLMIVDIRLINDNDKQDISGLLLAKKEQFRSIPKIILTAYPTYEHVREALGPALDGLPPAVEFLAKDEGADAMLRAVERVLAQHVRINWDLVIHSNESHPVSFPHLGTLIEPSTDMSRLPSRTEELTDLFRRLFFEKEHIKIDRVLWQSKGRVALSVFAFKQGALPEALVVVCGSPTSLTQESQAYKEFAASAAGGMGTALSKTAATTHFAANAYSLAGTNLENIHNLMDFYRGSSDKTFDATLKVFFYERLREWHREQIIREDKKTLDQCYRTRLGWENDTTAQGLFDERIESLLYHIPTLGVRVQREDGKLTFQLPGESVSYPDPLPALFQQSTIGHPVLLTATPGRLAGESILTDANGKTWLTDFSEAGLAPVLWNFVSLEAAIRFDWVETDKFKWLYDLERCLITGDFSKLNVSDIERPLLKPLRAIQNIRHLALEAVGGDFLSYHLGVFFQAADRLLSFDPTRQLTHRDIARLTHALISAAMICEKLGQSPTIKRKGLQIDKVNRTVKVDSVTCSLTPQGFDLLCYFYEHANQLCTRRDLIEKVFERAYNEDNESQKTLLDTAIRRLRERIEHDVNHPRYILTERGGGYRFVTHEQK